MQDDVFLTGGHLAPELVQLFQIPQLLLSGVYRRSNGFFTFKKSLSKDEDLQAYCVLSTSKDSLLLILASNTWFRVLVKAVSPDNSSYTWHETTFYSRWDPQGCVVLCIGVDLASQHLLQQT
jgi:hypothetical protein